MTEHKSSLGNLICCCGHAYGQHVNWGTEDEPRYGACPQIDSNPKHHCRCDGVHEPVNHHGAGGEPYADKSAVSALRMRVNGALYGD